MTGLLVVFMMINFADKSVLGLAADEVRADLGLTATEFGLANSAFFLLFSVAAIVVGLVADRISPKALLLVMALLWSVAQVPVALGGGLAVLIASRIVLGAAEGPAFPVAQQATLAWFPNERRNLPGALVTIGITLGVIVSAPTLSWIIQNHDWRTALWVLSGVGLLWALAWYLVGADGKYSADRSAGTAESGGAAAPTGQKDIAAADAARVPYRRIYASRTWIGATLAYFVTYWVVALMLVWLPSFLRNGLGYSAETAGLVVILPWAVGAAVLLAQAFLSGLLMRAGLSSRVARGHVGGWTITIGAAACLAVPFVDGTTAQTILVAIGFGFGGAFATIAVTTIAELAPASRRGGALGTMNALVTTAGLAAPAVVGMMVDSQGSDGYFNAVLLSGGLLLVGAVASFALIDPARDAARLRR
ncbi:MFS transporter [Nocardiopsis aegyptia]|uniref:MFS transporter n=1 Tax=Nocardiopsis aegyptia TaxID=220378 RepID=UPI00367201DD